MTSQEPVERKEAPDALALAEELGKAIRRINDLFSFRRFIRRFIIALACTSLLDVAITVVLALFFSSLHNAQLSACHISNESRRDQVILWQGIVDKFASKNSTPQQRTADRDLIAFVDKTFHPLDCHKIYG